MNDELSVLDYIKALLTPWRGSPPPIPPLEIDEEIEFAATQGSQLDLPVQETEPVVSAITTQPTEEYTVQRSGFPWLLVLALGAALLAQITLEPRTGRSWMLGLCLYLLAVPLVIMANIRNEWSLPVLPAVKKITDQLEVRWVYLTAGAIFSFLAFLTLGGDHFTLINVVLWVCAMIFTCIGFWQPPGGTFKAFLSNFRKKKSNRELNIRISTGLVLLVLTTVVVVFFRFYRFSSVPPEMVSDHAEKLLDIWDVLHGQFLIFFPRNTGREGFQMYLTALIIQLFGSGYSFNSLKIGTILAGLLTLPFVYLIGLEISNKRAALLATLFAGIAYWPNVISRMGLRFTLYPFFLAPMLYFLVRGLRHSRRNDFILAGFFLGLGLHGYTPYRIVPLVVLAAVGLFLLHSQSKGFRKQTGFHLFVLILVSLVVFLPLLRFWFENPEVFSYRAFTRLGSIESPLPGPWGLILIKNLWNAIIMFFWSNGEIWPVSIPHRPALDIISAALYFTGIILLITRYVHRRNWLDLFLVLSIPILMLPSILSLAFPSENPTLNRTAGALVPVFLVVGLSFDGFLSGIKRRVPQPINTILAWTVGIVLLLASGYQNYDLVFNQYEQNYSQSAWNTSEIGGAIKDFTDTIGSQENAFVVAYPYWVDTRLVGMNAGFPTRDFAIWPEDLPKTVDASGPKLFIIKEEDTDSLVDLQNLFPEGIVQRYTSSYPGKDFYQFFVFSE